MFAIQLCLELISTCCSCVNMVVDPCTFYFLLHMDKHAVSVYLWQKHCDNLPNFLTVFEDFFFFNRGKVPCNSHRARTLPVLLVLPNILLPDLPQTPRVCSVPFYMNCVAENTSRLKMSHISFVMKLFANLFKDIKICICLYHLERQHMF